VRLRPLGLLLFGLMVVSSACSMDATAPASLAAPESAALARGGKSTHGPGSVTAVDLFAGASATTYTVTIEPQRRNVLHFGPHTLDIPANAICDEQSGYGAEVFELDCRRENRRVTITATVRSTATGIPRIDLMPAMRFSPSRTVTLTLYVPDLSPASAPWNILYCATETTDVCVDESLFDATMRTQANFGTSTLFRRIKHFSGYFVES
jgi:hypothetical protein